MTRFPGIPALATLALMGCSAPESSTGGDDLYTVELIVGARDGLPACTSQLAGTTAWVQSPSSLWSCTGRLWVEIPCTTLLGGAVAYASGSQTLLACVSSHWTAVTLPAGQQGPPGASVVVTTEPAGANCAEGGVRLQVGSGPPTYVCNGDPGGSGISWTVAAADTTAAANHGYIAASGSQIAVTLPPSSSLVLGDEIDVSAESVAGFTVLANAGQTIQFGDGITDLFGVTWTPRESNRNWRGVASSADGNNLVAADEGGQLYTSTDAGATWTPRDANRNWASVASSADGTKLVAVVVFGQIYTSTDAGATWTPRDSDRQWNSVASSADGNKLVASTRGGQLYTSTDAGATWTARDSGRMWVSVASSADGTKLVAAVQNAPNAPAQLYTSSNAGLTWTLRDSSDRFWTSVASSADGTKLVAAEGGGQLYTSTDAGSTWTPRDANRDWLSVASSADGSRLVAAVSFGQLYTSTDSGSTWTARDSNRPWWSVASSADGSKLVGAERDGHLYTSTSTPGVGSKVVGAAGSTVRLLYVAPDSFLVVDGFGTLSAF